MKHKIGPAAPLGLFIGICFFFAIGLTRDPSVLPSNLIDKPMPQFELTELNDITLVVSEEELSGRITLLNVFGSWCQACLVEHPTLMRMNENSEVSIVGINWRDERDQAKQWLSKHGDPYDYILFDEDSSLSISLGVTGAPETFVIGPDKQIKYKHVGPITDDVFASTISPLLTELRTGLPDD